MTTASASDLPVTLPRNEPADSDHTDGRSDGADAHKQRSLDEVVVTATRREESLNDVPISVTALSQKALDDMHVQSFSDLATVTPGLVLTTTGGNAQTQSEVVIRGIFSNGNSPTTGLYIDDTSIGIRRMDAAGYSGTPQPDIFDLERVEVLRGPQGTLFGASAMGGAIRYITPQPSLSASSGYAKAEAGFTDGGSPSYAVGGAYGAPIVQGRAGFRISGWFHTDGGFILEQNPYTGDTIKRNANSSDTYVFRPALTIAPVDGLTFTPAAFLQHFHSDASDQYWLSDLPDPGAAGHVSGLGRGPTSLADDLKVFSLAIKYDIHGLMLQSDTSYLTRNFNGFDDWTAVIPFFLGGPTLIPSLSNFTPFDQNVGTTKAWQQDFRLVSPTGDRWNWVAGAFYRHAVTTLAQLIAPDLSPLTEALFNRTSGEVFGVSSFNFNGTPLASYSAFSTTDVQTALYGEATVGLVGNLKANLGLRIEHSVVEDQSQVIAGSLQGTTFDSETAPDEVENPVTPRVGLTYQYSEKNMVYATAAKGYRPGGSTPAAVTSNSLCAPSVAALGLSSVPSTYRSDSLWSYELGAKGALFERRFAFQASVFYIDWRDIQSRLALPSCGQTFTSNQGRAISKGFDLQIAAVPFDNLHLSANVGYVDAYYPKASFGAPSLDGSIPLVHAAGDPIYGTVPWTGSFRGDYSVGIGSLWDGARSYVRLDYRWLDRIANSNPLAANTDNTLGTVINDAYDVLNLRLGVLHEGLDISAFVNNVANSDPRLAFSHIGAFSATAIAPRTIGITALYYF